MVDRDQTRRDALRSWCKANNYVDDDPTAPHVEAFLAGYDALLSEREQADRDRESEAEATAAAVRQWDAAEARLAQLQETLRHERFITPGEEARLEKVQEERDQARDSEKAAWDSQKYHEERADDAEQERDAFRDALDHERSLNESVVAPMRARLAKVPALVEALREISCLDDRGEWLFTSREVARDALAVWEQE